MHRVSTLDFIHHSRRSCTCLKLKIDLQPGATVRTMAWMVILESHISWAWWSFSQQRNLQYKKAELWIDLSIGSDAETWIMGGDGAATACAVAEQPNPTLETGHG